MIGESKQLMILTLIAVIASGCASTTNTGDTTSGTGPISVNTFEGTPNPATADRTVNINLELENTGDADAERVAAQLFGPTFANSNTDNLAWRVSSGEEVTQEERTLSFDELRAPGENTPSVPKRKSLSLTAPALSQGRSVDYNFKSNIFYKYETTANTDFTLVSGERFQNENLERTEATLEASSGPVDLEIRGTTPKIFYKDDNEEGINSEICIRVINSGTGSTFLGGEVDSERLYDLDEDNENKVELTIQDISNVEFDAKSPEDGNTATVELVGGEEGFQCFDMTAGSLGNTEEQTINTQITAEYGYMKEDQTTVTVEGRRGLENNGDDEEDQSEASGENKEDSDLPELPQPE